MARFIGINRGQYYNSVTDASSTQSKDVEVQIQTNKNLTIQDMQTAFEQFALYLQTSAARANIGDNNG